MSTRNNEILQRIPNPDWHTELPKYYVIDDSPDMFDQMMAYATAGVRSVEVLTREEYEYLVNKENERLKEEAKHLVFAESEVTEKLMAHAAKRGIKLNVVSDERYQTDTIMGWLASISSDAEKCRETDKRCRTALNRKGFSQNDQGD